MLETTVYVLFFVKIYFFKRNVASPHSNHSQMHSMYGLFTYNLVEKMVTFKGDIPYIRRISDLIGNISKPAIFGIPPKTKSIITSKPFWMKKSLEQLPSLEKGKKNTTHRFFKQKQPTEMSLKPPRVDAPKNPKSSRLNNPTLATVTTCFYPVGFQAPRGDAEGRLCSSIPTLATKAEGGWGMGIFTTIGP